MMAPDLLATTPALQGFTAQASASRRHTKPLPIAGCIPLPIVPTLLSRQKVSGRISACAYLCIVSTASCSGSSSSR